MKTLNEYTQEQSGENFNMWSIANFQLTDSDKNELAERLAVLENTVDLDVKADGFSDDEYDDFSDMDLSDELYKLRSLVN